MMTAKEIASVIGSVPVHYNECVEQFLTLVQFLFVLAYDVCKGYCFWHQSSSCLLGCF